MNIMKGTTSALQSYRQHISRRWAILKKWVHDVHGQWAQSSGSSSQMYRPTVRFPYTARRCDDSARLYDGLATVHACFVEGTKCPFAHPAVEQKFKPT